MVVQRVQLLAGSLPVGGELEVSLAVSVSVSRTGLHGLPGVSFTSRGDDRRAEFRSGESSWAFLGLYLAVPT